MQYNSNILGVENFGFTIAILIIWVFINWPDQYYLAFGLATPSACHVLKGILYGQSNKVGNLEPTLDDDFNHENLTCDLKKN